jgi:hypothetical protein
VCALLMTSTLTLCAILLPLLHWCLLADSCSCCCVHLLMMLLLQSENFQELYEAFREALKVTEEDIHTFSVSALTADIGMCFGCAPVPLLVGFHSCCDQRHTSRAAKPPHASRVCKHVAGRDPRSQRKTQTRSSYSWWPTAQF